MLTIKDVCIHRIMLAHIGVSTVQERNQLIGILENTFGKAEGIVNLIEDNPIPPSLLNDLEDDDSEDYLENN